MGKTTNYCLLKAILTYLERLEIQRKVSFFDYNPNTKEDIQKIAIQSIQPKLLELSKEDQNLVRWSIEYHTTIGLDDFQSTRDEVQELSLEDPESWEDFFTHFGSALYGENFLDEVNPDDYIEKPDQVAAGKPFNIYYA